ncbi:hypothetical protein YDYSY3_04060 [Paenibacillus chitinolyticus]|uniref:hypothetical protein n=1 Tax=Paenibacillus chitinolyticus TaxID=79263 RepID=UPI0026E4F065|nr:hypothetical protein [Paenibacillus chitinolyticus]GKS09406.1 hypothetical protein YDYSY3_04060 [Paenibacillus chitinolyticus]
MNERLDGEEHVLSVMAQAAKKYFIDEINCGLNFGSITEEEEENKLVLKKWRSNI